MKRSLGGHIFIILIKLILVRLSLKCEIMILWYEIKVGTIILGAYNNCIYNIKNKVHLINLRQA